MAFHIGKDEKGRKIILPDEAITQTFALLARRGAGKTYTANVLAEEMLAGGHQIVILDPIGAWWGLRSGYAIAILGGEHQDIPLDPQSGKTVAQFVVSERLSVLLDLSTFGENEMRRFVADFGNEFYRENRDPVHLFIEEADEFAPQSGHKGGPLAACLGAMQRIVRRGRQRGIGCTLITQRSAVISKDLLTQTECLIAMQTTSPQDLDAIKGWVQYNGSKDDTRKILESLPKMQQGQAWLYSPGWLQKLVRFDVRKRRTHDASATPKPGQKRKAVTLADVNLSALSDKMAETIKEAKAKDPKELSRRIRELEKELGNSKTAAEESRAVLAERKKWSEHYASLHQSALDIQEGLAALTGPISRLAYGLSTAPNAKKGRSTKAIKHRTETPAKPARQAAPVSSGNGSIDLPKGERIILIAIAQHPDGVSREQLTVLTGYKKTSRDVYLTKLRSRGLATRGPTTKATDDGVAALGDHFEPLPTGDRLRQYWLNKLPKGEALLLRALVDAYPDWIDREILGEAAGYKKTSRDVYIQKLRARRLVETASGEARATDILFD